MQMSSLPVVSLFRRFVLISYICLGTSNIIRLKERLHEELSASTHSLVRIHEVIGADRQYLPFMGATNSCANNSKDQMWIDKKDYYDIGPKVIKMSF